MGDRKFNCNILEDDFLSVKHLSQDVTDKDDDDNFVDVQIYDGMGFRSLGVTLSLSKTKELIKELQSYVDKNNR